MKLKLNWPCALDYQKGEIPFWYHLQQDTYPSSTQQQKETQVQSNVIQIHGTYHSTVRSRLHCLGAMINANHQQCHFACFLFSSALISAARNQQHHIQTTTYNLLFSCFFFPEHMPRIVVRFRRYWICNVCGPQRQEKRKAVCRNYVLI